MKYILSRHTLSAILAACAMTAAAQSPQYMDVTVGEKVSQLTVSDISEITFDDTNMSIHLTDNNVCIFPNTENWKITFSDTSLGGITSVTITGDDSPVTVYDMQGQIITTAPRLSELDLSSYPTGVYIVRRASTSHKINNRK